MDQVNSDIMTFDYNCQWTNFSIQHSYDWIRIPTHVAPDWAPFVQGWSPVPNGSFLGDVVVPIQHPGDRDSLSGFLFVDGSIIDLRGIKSSTKTNYDAGYENHDWSLPSPTSTIAVLLCDPLYKIYKANVTLVDSRLTAAILPGPLVGNVPEPTANLLFSGGLLYALGVTAFVELQLSRTANLVFLENSTNTGFRPLPLANINQNMNDAITSGAKAFMSGFNPATGGPVLDDGNHFWFNQTVTAKRQQLSISASRPFFIVVSTLDAIAIIILIVTTHITDIEKMRLFSLGALEQVYKDESEGDN